MKHILAVMLVVVLCSAGCTGIAQEYSGLSCAPDATEISLSNVRIASVKQLLQDLQPYQDLKSLTLANCSLNLAQVIKLHHGLPGAVIHADFTWNKAEFHTDDPIAVLPNAKYSFQELQDFISVMNCLETLDMTAFQSNAKRMAAMKDTYPDLKLLFAYSISGHGVTSKITAFSSLGGGDSPRRDEKYFECLQYCPDLLALDLGHQKIRNLDFLRFYPELRVLILADNLLESDDLQMLVEYCPKLEYLELFMNKLTDLTPLKGLTHLRDLNLAHNQIEDVTPLLEMPWLERLWIAHNQFGTQAQDALREALPNTTFEF